MASSTFNPDANPESTSVDGYIANEPGSGTWATVRSAATGTAADDSSATVTFCYIRQVAPSANYDIWRRGFFLFDTSSLPDTATISSAVLSVYHNSHGNTIGGTPSLVVVSSSPASNTSLSTGDFGSTGTTAYSNTVLLSAMTNGSYVDFTLNASGIAAINKSGVSKFALVFEEDRANSEPTWTGGGNEWYVNGEMADTGGGNKPKLVVTYTTATNNDKMFQVF